MSSEICLFCDQELGQPSYIVSNGHKFHIACYMIECNSTMDENIKKMIAEKEKEKEENPIVEAVKNVLLARLDEVSEDYKNTDKFVECMSETLKRLLDSSSSILKSGAKTKPNLLDVLHDCGFGELKPNSDAKKLNEPKVDGLAGLVTEISKILKSNSECGVKPAINQDKIKSTDSNPAENFLNALKSLFESKTESVAPDPKKYYSKKSNMNIPIHNLNSEPSSSSDAKIDNYEESLLSGDVDATTKPSTKNPNFTELFSHAVESFNVAQKNGDYTNFIDSISKMVDKIV